MSKSLYVCLLALFSLFVLSGCGDDGRISATTTRNLPDINLTDIAPFNELYEFPGNITGFTANFSIFTLMTLEVCFNIDADLLDLTGEEFPVRVSIANQDYTPEMFHVEHTDTIDQYCFNPLVEEGVYNINVELHLNSGWESYSWDFQSTLPVPFELSQLDDQLSGLEWITGEMLRELDAEIERDVRYLIPAGRPICVDVYNSDIIGAEIRDSVEIALDQRVLGDDALTVERVSNGERFCIENVLQSGLHELYILMTTSPSLPAGQIAFVGEFLVVENE